MSGLPTQADLLSSLGRLVRGLSALFWGLPLTLVVCVQTAKGDWLRPFGVVPPVVTTALICYGLSLLGHFQKQERVWRAALDRAKVFALLNLGFSPFLYWWSRVQDNSFFFVVVHAMLFTGLLFLLLLNPLLCRLTAMLPDETIRGETKFFTMLNRCLLVATLTLVAACVLFRRSAYLPPFLSLDEYGLWLVLFLVLLPLAMTMALIWKIKEVILAGVFGPEH